MYGSLTKCTKLQIKIIPRRRKLMSESSGHSETETEIGQDGKFLNLKIDKATSDKLRPKKSAQEKKKSVMFKVGKDEVR